MGRGEERKGEGLTQIPLRPSRKPAAATWHSHGLGPLGPTKLAQPTVPGLLRTLCTSEEGETPLVLYRYHPVLCVPDPARNVPDTLTHTVASARPTHPQPRCRIQTDETASPPRTEPSVPPGLVDREQCRNHFGGRPARVAYHQPPLSLGALLAGLAFLAFLAESLPPLARPLPPLSPLSPRPLPPLVPRPLPPLPPFW